MKKFLLISFIGLALIGCNDNKITKEYLVGEWSCEVKTEKADWVNGDFRDYGKLKLEKNQPRYFKLVEDKLYFSTDNNRWAIFPIDQILKDKKFESEENSTSKVRGSRDIQYVSRDNYIFNFDSEYHAKDGFSEEIGNMKLKGTQNCTRIK